jgi:SAM-dependent methyltransferase
LSNQEDYDRYYKQYSRYEFTYTDEKSPLYKERANHISLFLEDKQDSIIDIGCGNGQLLLELQKLGYSNLTALDPSQKCIDFLKTKKIDGIQSSIFKIPKTHVFDNAILSGVLEHIYDIKKLMILMKRVVRDNGLLFVYVPDASRYKNFDIVPFDYFNIEHINHFDEISLINLGLAYAWETFGMIKSTVDFHGEKQPIIFQVFKNKNRQAYEYESYSSERVYEYIEHTSSGNKIERLINTLIDKHEEIIIWGAGNYTSRLLKTTDLSKCNIMMFIDNDANKHGKCLSGKIIFPPNKIKEIKGDYSIVIAAAVFHEEIKSQIKNMGICNRVIVLR